MQPCTVLVLPCPALVDAAILFSARTARGHVTFHLENGAPPALPARLYLPARAMTMQRGGAELTLTHARARGHHHGTTGAARASGGCGACGPAPVGSAREEIDRSSSTPTKLGDGRVQ
jgi:hypothetical protein